MIAGPYVLGWVKDPVTINDLSAIGVVLLLFIIGLELDPIELRRMANKVAVIVILEVGLSFGAGYFAASYFLGTGPLQAVIFGMVAGITSTAIVGKVFLEHHRSLETSEPRALMGMMIIEDMVAVVFLIALSSFSTNGSLLSSGSLVQILETIAGGLALVVTGYLTAAHIAPRIIDYLSPFEEEYEEIPFLFALGLGFFFAVLAAVFGYSPGTGAFIIGLSIRGKHSKFLARRVAAIKDLFIVLFFVSMGSLIDPLPALAVGLPLLGVLVLVGSGKFIGGFCFGQDLPESAICKGRLSVRVLACSKGRVLLRNRATRPGIRNHQQQALFGHRSGRPRYRNSGPSDAEVRRGEASAGHVPD